ncbi:hypothetical protein MKK88_23105 [Methylobacterium sp. E-005]|uniref:hypothetical protein n=1 Tax=Methylobacterium sp. E-005 TaxID=2836549 RepID=UPI001FBA8EDF|nr:hypothetical protein [Methylobacterium sp. E-005]MCJ2088845.1 hypothetical protein [Methylobacterium sp. E-005]
MRSYITTNKLGQNGRVLVSGGNMVSRIAVLGLLLLTTSACSRLPNVPTAYSSLPALTPGHDAVLKAVPSPVAPAVPVAALPVIRIPGTALAHGAESPAEPQGPRVNPTDVLAASARARLAWQTLHPTELMRPAFGGRRDAFAHSIDETGAIGAGEPPAKVETSSYDRAAMMARLEKEGRRAGKPICSGC